MISEVVGGVFSNSLAIATDAAHLLTGVCYSICLILLTNYFRLGLLHDLPDSNMAGSKTKKSENVVWLAQSRGPGGDHLSPDDLGGDGGACVHGYSEADHQRL